MLHIFVDTSAFFSGIYSKSGYAHDLLSMATEGRCLLVTHSAVLEEMEKNLRKQRDPRHLSLYQLYLRTTPITIVPDSTSEQLLTVAQYVVKKDAVIVAAAISWHQQTPIDYFVTYDRQHILKPDIIEKSGLNIVIPKDAVEAIIGNR